MGKPTKANPTGTNSQGAAGKEHTHSRELFALKYIRFSCEDLIKTREFYTCLGMSVEWQLRSSKNNTSVNNNNVPATPGNAAPPAAEEATAVVASDAPKDDKTAAVLSQTPNLDPTKPKTEEGLTLVGISTEEPPPKPQESEAANGSPNVYKTDLCLTFATPSVNGAETIDQCHFQLLFTNFSVQKPEDKDDLNPGATNPPTAKNLLPPPPPPPAFQDFPDDKKKKERNQEYLVIYVHFLPRIIKRLATKGFETFMAPTAFQGAQIAILIDPNGIEVRLIELTEQQVDDPNTLVKRQWFARMGYYTIPAVKLETTARYYERMFSYMAVAPAAGGGG
ncbi:UNVERIFIED_CONTAM: hypothetical protein HDU68_005282 [Siphonaria sp. JEL0065]|nr:hypothetical protein HDU68_005282 [Siphonaria sp. JEL0065]